MQPVTVSKEMDEKITTYATLLGVSKEEFIVQALQHYFNVAEELLHANGTDESALTKFSYDEFWDGVDTEDT